MTAGQFMHVALGISMLYGLAIYVIARTRFSPVKGKKINGKK